MKPLPALFALAALLGAARPLPADEVPHLDFVRELRARYPDLALEYLDQLRKSNPPAGVAAIIPLELAKVHLDLATAEADGSRRLALYNKARAEFQEFIDKNPTNVLVGDARVDLARVTALQARTQLSRALLQEDPAVKQKEALAARQTFAEANTQLRAAADQLAQDVAKHPDPKTPQETAAKRALQQAHLQAQLDLGLNLLDQAETYLDTGNVQTGLERVKIVNQAIAAFDKVAAGDAKSPLTWQARAWSGYALYQKGEGGPRAAAKLKEVAAETEPVAAAGRRLALFFQMKVAIDPPAVPKEADVAQVHKDAEAWVSDYRNFLGTPEGCGVRYYLADVLYRQAGDMKDKTARKQQLDRAAALCRDLMRTDNDYAEKARLLNIHIISVEGGFNRDIAKLTNFEDCLVRAEYEGVKADEFARKPGAKPEEVEKERKARIDNAVQALKRGLEYAARPGSKVPPAEVGKARSMLCGYYLFSSKYKEAIAVGEEAARAVPPTAQSARTAMYVIEAYNDLINESLRDGTASLADLEKDGITTRMSDLALMMEQRWPSEQAGDVARHMRGLLLIKQKKPLEAIDALAKVSPTYPAAIYVKYQLAMTAFQTAQDRNAQAKAETDKAKKEQWAREEAQLEKQAVEALKAMPPLPPGADPVTAGLYVNSKVELARAYYRAGDYAAIDKLIDPLIDGLKKGEIKLDPPRDDEARTSLGLVKLFGKYGAANAEFAAGHPDKVKEITDPIITAILKGEYAKELKANPDLRWGLMGLALRVSIQEKNTARALQIYEAAKKATAADAGEKGGTKAILIQIAVMVKDQVREVRKKKDAKAFEEAVAEYSKFLDALRTGEKTPSAEFLRVLAEAYAALGKHDTAVELARQVAEPKDEDAKDVARTSNYHFCRILIVRELREAGKAEEARAELDQVRQSSWGKEHPEAIKEGIHLLPPGKAYSEWSKLVNQLGQKLQQGGTKEARDQFFECYYYMTECMVKFAQGVKDEKKKEDYLKRAANLIVKLEQRQPDLGGDESKLRFTDLLDREPALKEQYDKLKGGDK
jgi:tetratricopeptide (TPR) repeat protein